MDDEEEDREGGSSRAPPPRRNLPTGPRISSENRRGTSTGPPPAVPSRATKRTRDDQSSMRPPATSSSRASKRTRVGQASMMSPPAPSAFRGIKRTREGQPSSVRPSNASRAMGLLGQANSAASGQPNSKRPRIEGFRKSRPSAISTSHKSQDRGEPDSPLDLTFSENTPRQQIFEALQEHPGTPTTPLSHLERKHPWYTQYLSNELGHRVEEKVRQEILHQATGTNPERGDFSEVYLHGSRDNPSGGRQASVDVKSAATHVRSMPNSSQGELYSHSQLRNTWESRPWFGSHWISPRSWFDRISGGYRGLIEFGGTQMTWATFLLAFGSVWYAGKALSPTYESLMTVYTSTENQIEIQKNMLGRLAGQGLKDTTRYKDHMNHLQELQSTLSKINWALTLDLTRAGIVTLGVASGLMVGYSYEKHRLRTILNARLSSHSRQVAERHIQNIINEEKNMSTTQLAERLTANQERFLALAETQTETAGQSSSSASAAIDIQRQQSDQNYSERKRQVMNSILQLGSALKNAKFTPEQIIRYFAVQLTNHQISPQNFEMALMTFVEDKSLIIRYLGTPDQQRRGNGLSTRDLQLLAQEVLENPDVSSDAPWRLIQWGSNQDIEKFVFNWQRTTPGNRLFEPGESFRSHENAVIRVPGRGGNFEDRRLLRQGRGVGGDHLDVFDGSEENNCMAQEGQGCVALQPNDGKLFPAGTKMFDPRQKVVQLPEGSSVLMAVRVFSNLLGKTRWNMTQDDRRAMEQAASRTPTSFWSGGNRSQLELKGLDNLNETQAFWLFQWMGPLCSRWLGFGDQEIKLRDKKAAQQFAKAGNVVTFMTDRCQVRFSFLKSMLFHDFLFLFVPPEDVVKAYTDVQNEKGWSSMFRRSSTETCLSRQAKRGTGILLLDNCCPGSVRIIGLNKRNELQDKTFDVFESGFVRLKKPRSNPMQEDPGWSFNHEEVLYHVLWTAEQMGLELVSNLCWKYLNSQTSSEVSKKRNLFLPGLDTSFLQQEPSGNANLDPDRTATEESKEFFNKASDLARRFKARALGDKAELYVQKMRTEVANRSKMWLKSPVFVNMSENEDVNTNQINVMLDHYNVASQRVVGRPMDLKPGMTFLGNVAMDVEIQPPPQRGSQRATLDLQHVDQSFIKAVGDLHMFGPRTKNILKQFKTDCQKYMATLKDISINGTGDRILRDIIMDGIVKSGSLQDDEFGELASDNPNRTSISSTESREAKRLLETKEIVASQICPGGVKPPVVVNQLCVNPLVVVAALPISNKGKKNSVYPRGATKGSLQNRCNWQTFAGDAWFVQPIISKLQSQDIPFAVGRLRTLSNPWSPPKDNRGDYATNYQPGYLEMALQQYLQISDKDFSKFEVSGPRVNKARKYFQDMLYTGYWLQYFGVGVGPM